MLVRINQLESDQAYSSADASYSPKDGKGIRKRRRKKMAEQMETVVFDTPKIYCNLCGEGFYTEYPDECGCVCPSCKKEIE